jgi:hypothetical protein
MQYSYNTHAPLGFCRGAYVSFGLTPSMLQLIASPGSLKVSAIIESNGKVLLERNPENGQLLLPTSNIVGDAGTPDRKWIYLSFTRLTMKIRKDLFITWANYYR